MARIRSLKPEAPQHRKVGKLSIWARWLWLTMLTQADDEGRLVADLSQLRVQAFAYDLDIDDVKVASLLAEIAATGLIFLYEVKGVPYVHFPSWFDHQRINRPTPSKLPPPPPPDKPSRSAHGILTEGSLRTHAGSEWIGGERKGSEGGDARGTKTAGDTPAPPIAHALSNTTNGNPHPAKRETAAARPPRGLYAEIRANIRRLCPELSSAEADERALKDYDEAVRRP